MYLVDFFKRMARKSNIPVIIYLVLNIFVIAGIVYLMCSGIPMPFWEALLIGLGLYIVSLVIALSPIGEWILRLQTGCRKIKRAEQLNFIMPIFNEVYQKAKALDPSISDNVQLYISDDEDPNAFATGRKTVCVTEGMMHMPPEQIKATLGHEFGHLAHKDTDLILVVSVGNLIVTTFIILVRLAIDISHILFGIITIFIGGSEGFLAAIFNTMYHAMITAIVSGLTWIWTKIGVLLVMKSSRANEFEADEFSFRLGYGPELCALLDTICGSNPKGLFANLASSHPDKDDRIAKLQALGASYGKTYGMGLGNSSYASLPNGNESNENSSNVSFGNAYSPAFGFADANTKKPAQTPSANNAQYGAASYSGVNENQNMNTRYGNQNMNAQHSSNPYGNQNMNAQHGSNPYGNQNMNAQYGNSPYGNQNMNAQYGNQNMNAQYGNQGMNTQYGNSPYGNQNMNAQYGSNPYGNQGMNTQYGNSPYGNQNMNAQYGNSPYGNQGMNTQYGNSPYGNQNMNAQYGNQNGYAQYGGAANGYGNPNGNMQYSNFQYNGPANGNANYNPYGNAQYGAGYGGNYKNS